MPPIRWDLEQLAQEVRKRAGLRDDDVELVTRIAARVLGPDAIALDHRLHGAAYLRRKQGGMSPTTHWQIVVNPKAEDFRFHVAHELGEWALREVSCFLGTEAERERAANYIGAAILAPASAVRASHKRHGERVRRIAAHFQLSQTATVLRLGEVVGDERAVVTRSGNVLLRTRGAFPWSEVPILDVASGRRTWRGLKKATLRGGLDEGRVVLRAS